ncbi:MAG: prolipoprotein diacylglyceryl transferase [Dehalococcoidia bacterium]|nr:MAG: prolipoprotein diacylglyceryl transferase [Dehalococcoidia bacterium]
MEINIDPVAFTIGSLEIRWYGLMIALGVFILVLWTFWQVRKHWPSFPSDRVLALAIVGIPSGIIFARLIHVIDKWEYYSQNLGQIIGGEGLTIYGAILGAVLGTWIYSRFRPFNYGFGADLVAPGIILAQIIGRIGCFLNGCCHGPEASTSLPWGITYTHPNCAADITNIPVHPTQLYEIIFLVFLFGITMLLKGRLKPDGSLFLVYLGSYSLWRFSIGFLRVNEPFLFGLHQAQFIGIIVLVITIGLLIYNRVRFVKSSETPKIERKEE